MKRTSIILLLLFLLAVDRAAAQTALDEPTYADKCRPCRKVTEAQ